MKRFLKITILISVLICLIAFPLFVKAGLVPCGTSTTPECRLCHFLILIRNIFDFILKIIVPLAVLFAIGAGILILVSQGSQMAIQGKKILTSVIIGIAIALASWTIVNTIIVALVNQNEFPWPWYSWDLECPIVRIELREPALITSYALINDPFFPMDHLENTDSFVDKIIKLFIKPLSAQTAPAIRGVSPGDTLRYTATYTDISTSDLSNLTIIIDYDQDKISSIPDISVGGIDDGDKITWDLGDLNINQSVTVHFDFVLTSDIQMLLQGSQSKKDNELSFSRIAETFLKIISKKASGQTIPITTIYYQNTIHVSSNQAEPESLDDPLEITVPVGLFAERQYYLTLDVNGDGVPSVGDRLRYNIKYHNPTSLAFNDVLIISDYSQGFAVIINIDGGGVDDGDKVIWNLGDLEGGEPSPERPGCIGYDLTVIQRPGGLVIPNRFYIISEGGILEAGNDIFNIEDY